MNIIELFEEYLDTLSPATKINGIGSKLVKAKNQAAHLEVDSLIELAKVINYETWTIATIPNAKGCIRWIARRLGEDPTEALSYLSSSRSNTNPARSFEVEFNEVADSIRALPSHAAAICALAFGACLKPEHMLQISEIKDGLIKFYAKKPRAISGEWLELITELVDAERIQEIKHLHVVTGDPKLDRLNISQEITNQRKGGFPYTLFQLARIGAVIRLKRDGWEAVQEVSELLSMGLSTLKSNVKKGWVSNGGISEATSARIQNA